MTFSSRLRSFDQEIFSWEYFPLVSHFSLMISPLSYCGLSACSSESFQKPKTWVMLYGEVSYELKLRDSNVASVVKVSKLMMGGEVAGLF